MTNHSIFKLHADVTQVWPFCNEFILKNTCFESDSLYLQNHAQQELYWGFSQKMTEKTALVAKICKLFLKWLFVFVDERSNKNVQNYHAQR